MRATIMLLAGAMWIQTSVSFAQLPGQDKPQATTTKRYFTRNMGGPRLGVTIIPGDGELAQKLAEHNVGKVISQFGWHFEKAVAYKEDGPSFIIEFVPLFGGVEFGKFILGITLGLGIRLPNGFEIGAGPNILFGENVSSALMIAVGKSFDYGGVAIPLNLAVVTSPIGTRFAIMTGYAID